MTRKPNKGKPKVQYDYNDDKVGLGDLVIELSNGLEHIVNLVLDDGGVMVHRKDNPEDYIFIPYGKYVVKHGTQMDRLHHYKNMVEVALDLGDEDLFKEYSSVVNALESTPTVPYTEPYHDHELLGSPTTAALEPQTKTQTTLFLIDLALDNKDEEEFNRLTQKLTYIKERKAELLTQLEEAKRNKQGALAKELEKRVGEM